MERPCEEFGYEREECGVECPPFQCVDRVPVSIKVLSTRAACFPVLDCDEMPAYLEEMVKNDAENFLINVYPYKDKAWYDEKAVKKAAFELLNFNPSLVAAVLIEYYLDEEWAGDIIVEAAKKSSAVIERINVFADKPWAENVVEVVAAYAIEDVLQFSDMFVHLPWAERVIVECFKKDPRLTLEYSKRWNNGQAWAGDISLKGRSFC